MEWCVYLASTAEDGARGLMEVDSLGDREGMLFDFRASPGSSFYMLKTRIPLAVGFFDAGGTFVSRADMVPCPDDDNDPACPLYGAVAAYGWSAKSQGDRPQLGIGRRDGGRVEGPPRPRPMPTTSPSA